MEFKNLLLETADGIATLSINRREALNSLNSAVLAELECALYELDLDASVKVVIITGAGEKAFVAGADIKEMSE
ncbi:MAG: enoyl-CoA hydratase-related protein, partial [Deltaproteobacteria bacterium]